MNQQTETEDNALVFHGQPMAMKGEKTMIQVIKLNQIKLNKNSRMNIKPDELSGLMTSIKEVGLLQPIGVVKMGPKSYEICYGNRRYLACSKLGLNSIPAIIHEKQKEGDIDMKNLTENIQRRNISLAEAGRYMKMLQKQQEMTPAELAARLGVSKSFVEVCTTSFESVPKEFHDDLETSYGPGQKVKPGKISMNVATKIISAKRSSDLSVEQTKVLFKAAKSDARFDSNNLRGYAEAIRLGSEDPIGAVEEFKHVMVNFRIPLKTFTKLYDENVTGGHYSSMRAFFVDVLNGKKQAKNLRAE